MNGLNWLLYANIAVWLGLGLYLFFLARKAAHLESRLNRMEYARQAAAAQTSGQEL